MYSALFLFSHFMKVFLTSSFSYSLLRYPLGKSPWQPSFAFNSNAVSFIFISGHALTSLFLTKTDFMSLLSLDDQGIGMCTFVPPASRPHSTGVQRASAPRALPAGSAPLSWKGTGTSISVARTMSAMSESAVTPALARALGYACALRDGAVCGAPSSATEL